MTPRIRLALLLCALSLSPACKSGGLSMFIHPKRQGPRNDEGELDGFWRYWYDFDRAHLQAQGTWKRDEQDGPWTYFYADGKNEWEGEFRGHRLSGLSSFWYSGGEPRARGIYDGGFEQGAWTFWSSAGKIEQQGEFDHGQMSGRWTYWNDAEKPVAEGFRWAGERIGLWRFWNEAGVLCEKLYSLPVGAQLACEEYEGGQPRREGLLIQGQRQGPWVEWNEDGSRRSSGSFRNGRPHGFWIVWDQDNFPVAAGRVADGRIVGAWEVWSEGRCLSVPCEHFEQPAVVSMGTREGPATPIEQLVGQRIAEAELPVGSKLAPRVPSGAAAPSLAQLEASERHARIPIRAQPWTETQQENLDYLLNRYTKGVRAVPRPMNGPYRNLSTAATGDTRRSEPIIGKPLPQTVFTDGLGARFDTSSLKGKKVVLVILRGFDGCVCVYCAQQTKALANLEREFKAHDAEVVLLYPGPEDRLGTFREAVEANSEGAGPRYKLLADPELRLVKPLDLIDQLARPTTLILDEQGVVRWAYVGTSKEDRPDCAMILTALEKLGRR